MKTKNNLEEEQNIKNGELELSYEMSLPRYRYIDESGEHLHTLDGKSLLGTSTVVGVIAKPLTWWASGKAVECLGWTNSKNKIGGKYVTTPLEARIRHVEPRFHEIRGMTPVEYLGLLDEAYKAHSVSLKSSAGKGTDLHALLEIYVKSCILENQGMPLGNGPELKEIVSFIEWSMSNIKRFIYSEANCYSEKLWVGGISDCMAELADGRYVIIDFKSSKESYESQFVQCSGYSLQIEENGWFSPNGQFIDELNGRKIEGYAIVPFGAPKFTVDFRFNVDELKEGFKAACVLYKLTNK